MTGRHDNSATGRSRRGEARPNAAALVLIGLLPLLFLALVPVPFLRAFELTLSDQRMVLRNRLAPRPIPSNIKVIGVGVADEERLDVDLRSRLVYTNLMGVLRRWGVHTVAFDLFFDSVQEHDQFLSFSFSQGAPRAVLATSFRPVELGLRPLGSVPEDLLEAASLAANGENVAVIVDWIRDLDDYEEELRGWIDRERLESPGADSTRVSLQELAWVRHLRQELKRRWMVLVHGVAFQPAEGADPYVAADVRLLSPELAFGAHAIGFANVEKGEEQVVRHAPLVYTFEGRLFPHLALAAALSWFGVPFSEVDIDWGRELRFTPATNHTPGESIRIPIDHRGRYTVNFREAEDFLNRHPTLAAVALDDFREILLGDEATVAGEWRDSIVLVGEVISGGVATDLEPIPLQAQFPMVGLHANVLANILERDFIRVPDRLSIVLVYSLVGIVVALLFLLLPFKSAAILAVLLGVVYTVAQFAVFAAWNVALPIVAPISGLLLSVLGFFYYLVLVKDRDRRLVRDVFLKSVSPRIGEEILKNYHDEAIWGSQREITVLFIDIRGYTTLSESRGPAVVLEVLEKFYETVSEAVFLHDGQVNKFLGDAVLALFGALPEEPPGHAGRAAKAAIEIQRSILAINDSPWGREIGVELNTGAGVHTGMATVGLVGRREIRIEYTALGDAVNVASRLQNLAAHGEVVFSRETLEQLSEDPEEFFAALKTRLATEESLHVKGRQQPVAVRKAEIIRDTP